MSSHRNEPWYSLVANGSDKDVQDLYGRVAQYLRSLNLAKQMYHRGIIDLDDYGKAEALLAEKYGLSEKSIFRVYSPDDGSDFKGSDSK